MNILDQRRKAYDVFPQVVAVDEFMRRVDSDQGLEWTLVDPYEVKEKLGIDLPELWGTEFEEAYAKVEEAVASGGLELYKQVNARHLFKEIMRSQIETGLPYIAFKDTINRANPNKHEGYIPGVNLCVAPETKILTNRGYETIGDLENQPVTLWNGKEWSETTVVKTGENQELLKVNFSNGESVECTPYHKFYIQKGSQKTGKVVKLEAKDLKQGDRLIKFDLPVISSEEDQEMDYAYTHGFFCGDGSHDGMGKPEIDLYGKKKDLLPFLDVRNKMYGSAKGGKAWRIEREEVAVFDDTKQDRLVLKLPLDLYPKFFVPVSGYTITSRLAWLAGLLDADGTVCRQGESEALQLASVNKPFLLDIRLMLHTMGVDAKIALHRKEGDYLLPDGKGSLKGYHCKTVYRLLISSYGLYRLAVLGLRTNRLKWVTRKPKRNAERFIEVSSLEHTGRISDTYCFHELKRNMGMFNGILMGNCVESFANVVPGKLAHTCLAEGTKVLTSKGWLPIEECDGIDVSVPFSSDETFDYAPQRLPATLIPKGEQEVFKITMVSTSSLMGFEESFEATADHRVVGAGSLGFHWREVKDLKVGDKLQCYGEDFGYKVLYTKVITSIEPAGVKRVYDLGLASGHNYVAECAIHHNCNLDSLNLANIEDDEIQDSCEVAVRLLDNTIELTNTPFQDSKDHNVRYRTIGVGAMGLADWLAKRKLNYSSVKSIDHLFEEIGYYCTKASVELAKERGIYPAFEGSEWSKGHLIGSKPVEWYEENSQAPERWVELSEEVKKHGIRNSHITAIAPNTSSSLIQGCTASILPTYSKFFYDKWAKGTVPIAPPFIGESFWFYQENKSVDQATVVKAVATIQKWIDTGISMELIFNLNEGVYYPDEPERALKAKGIFDTLMLAWKQGCKAIYYIRTVQKDNFKETEGCSSCAN